MITHRQSDFDHPERLPRVPARYATRWGYAFAMTLAALPFALIAGAWISFGLLGSGDSWTGTAVFAGLVIGILLSAGSSAALLWPSGSRSRRRMKWTGLGVTALAVFIASFLLGVLITLTDPAWDFKTNGFLLLPLAGVAGLFFSNFLTLGLHWPVGIITSLLFRD